MPSQKKKSQLQGIIDFLSTSSHLTFIHFGSTPHRALETLRKTLHAQEARVKIVKNSLLKKALERLEPSGESFSALSSHAADMKKNTGVVSFKKDWTDGLKHILSFTKEHEQVTFRFGILDNAVYDGNSLMHIADLPPKQVLAATIIRSMKSPAARTVIAMKYPIQKLVYVLNAKAKQI